MERRHRAAARAASSRSKNSSSSALPLRPRPASREPRAAAHRLRVGMRPRTGSGARAAPAGRALLLWGSAEQSGAAAPRAAAYLKPLRPRETRYAALPGHPSPAAGRTHLTPLRSRGARSPQRDAASLPETLPSLTQETIPAAGRHRPSSPSSLAAAQRRGPQGTGRAGRPPEALGLGAVAPRWVPEAPTCKETPRGAPGHGGAVRAAFRARRTARRASPEPPCSKHACSITG